MTESKFERHPRLTLCLFLCAALAVLAITAEIGLRFVIPYNIGYYTAIREEGVYRYPYGDILINDHGYPDKAFDLASERPRIGYVGDSIIMGVGAGDGYRISDLLEQHYPAYEHWTFGAMGNGLLEDKLLALIEQYKLGKIIYGFNLNDFLPRIDENGLLAAGKDTTTAEKLLRRIQIFVSDKFDGLRGRSYLYTAARTGVKNILQSLGYGHTGFKSAELYPSTNEDLIREVAGRLNDVAARLAAENIDFCLVIFPYEMQISKQAAATYRKMGIHWENGFENGSTQDQFLRHLAIPHIYDARQAFASVPNSAAGTYFVFDQGDKIDFNHPNRAGHKLITEGLIRSGACKL